MDKFKVGDRVRIIKNVYDASFVGLEATILSPKKNMLCREPNARWDIYELDIEGKGSVRQDTGSQYGLPEDWLAPIYDGYEKTTWNQCLWRPKVLEKV